VPERVFRRIERPDVELIKRFEVLGVATVYEAMGVTLGHAQLMDAAISTISPGDRIVGPAITAQCHSGDNTMSHVAITLAEAGDVLVIAGGDPITALWGDLTGTAAKMREVAGIVLDGGVRDVAVLRDMGLPLWARTISPAKPVKGTPGSANVPVRAGGVLVNPGDLVMADDDGVLVVPRQHLVEILELAELRESNEAVIRNELENGDTIALYRMLGVEAILQKAGVEIIDDSYDAWVKRG
jgi:4-hydroxy-4-methyl-2-oxoglutarate aldolase